MAPKPKKPASQFVAMKKDGETIEVNPLCVEDHKKLGWKVVEEIKPEAEPEAPDQDEDTDK